MIFARKIYKIPEFYMIFARKMPEFYIIISRKMFFFRILGGHVPPLPCRPYATPMSWDKDELVRFWGQKVKGQGHIIAAEASSTRRCRRV